MTIRKRINKLQGFCIEDLSVGMSRVYQKTVKNNDVLLFAKVSGDNNPVHLDRKFARGTISVSYTHLTLPTNREV